MLSRSELQRELVRRPGAEPPHLDDAIGNLHAVGLVNVCGELVGALPRGALHGRAAGQPDTSRRLGLKAAERGDDGVRLALSSQGMPLRLGVQRLGRHVEAVLGPDDRGELRVDLDRLRPRQLARQMRSRLPRSGGPDTSPPLLPGGAAARRAGWPAARARSESPAGCCRCRTRRAPRSHRCSSADSARTSRPSSRCTTRVSRPAAREAPGRRRFRRSSVARRSRSCGGR
jgi:hypothetical protein